MSGNHKTNKATAAGLLIALGIIYGDIGTSPLYTLKAIVGNNVISDDLILGAISCIIWTLTLQTTIKYVLLTLKADNNGEGGIFSLYALIRRRAKWAVIPAMIGGAALLADGIITPPITVSSAIEGLNLQKDFGQFGTTQTIVIIIISLLFFIQQFGTGFVGKFFGPVMLVWFSMLAVLGFSHLADYTPILKAFNPKYAFNLLTNHHINSTGLLILGGIFLCTTGAEALYSDLGHCGRSNIRMSWIFVKATLILNYLGQGAWLLANYKGNGFIDPHATAAVIAAAKATITEQGGIINVVDFPNPFYGLMNWAFKPFGIAIATLAAIIASQALISGSFTLVSEAFRLNLWPKVKINYPSNEKGQLYIPAINTLLFLGCVSVVLYFKQSSKMEAAYGLSITICMLMTSVLFATYLYTKRTNKAIIALYLIVYVCIETCFLVANLDKFAHGGYVTVIIGSMLFAVMFVWFKSRKIKNRYVEFDRLDGYLPTIQELSNDNSIPKYATHLVYLTSANNPHEIEKKIMYSILNKKPKRADIYWLIHVDVVDDPYRMEYVVDTIMPNEIIRIEFRLGFRVEQRINLMFRKVVEDMVKNKEVNITSRYESLSKNKVTGDWQFIVMEKFLSHDNDLPLYERIIMNIYFYIKKFSLSEEKGFGLDSSYVVVEKFPLVVAPVQDISLTRVEKNARYSNNH
jgi:KUP system potassium uptake protein